ncbi:MAG: leucine-rich repeat protein [Clostridiales bacterium]|nr:leucine-rich repeat protein [Clostridiales bacterium]
MHGSSVFKRFTSLSLALVFVLGVIAFVPGAKSAADVDEAVVEINEADLSLTVGEEFRVGNGMYKIYDKGSVAFVGLSDPNTEAFSVPNVVVHNDVRYSVLWIAQSAFEGNAFIKKVNIGKNVKKICSRAFYGCTSLKTVSGGKGVTYTADDAFENCTSLKKLGRYYKGTYNVGLAYFGKAPKPWRKTAAGRNGKGEYVWITDEDLKVLGKTRESFSNEVLAACRKMAGTKYTNDMDCISYCMSAYAKALGVATSVGKGKSFKIKFAKNYSNNGKTKYAVNIMKKKGVINVNGSRITRNAANWFHCTNFSEHLTSKPDCYGGVKITDYASLADCMKALNAQPGDIVLFGGYVSTYLCKDGKYYKTGYSSHGGKKKVNGHYVRGEGNLFVWGHAAVYAGYNFTHSDNKGNMRHGQWFYETSNKVKAGLHWREPYYNDQGQTNQRVMVIHVGNPKASNSGSYTDPVTKVCGSDAVSGASYGVYRSEEDAARDFNRLCTVKCGASESELPEINLGRAASYEIASNKRITAKFYMRQLSDSGTPAPDKKNYLFRITAPNKDDLPVGWTILKV